MEGLKVKCPKCKRTGTYITTDKYNPNITPNGSMLKLKNPKYKGGLTYGSAKGSPPVAACFMECCDCGGLLTFGGKLIVIPDSPAGFTYPLSVNNEEPKTKRAKK